MVYLLGGLCAVLALTAAALAVKIALLRRAARELREGLTERLEGEDTNTLLTLPTRDRDMRALASDLNGQLRLLRERRQRYQQGDLTVKEAVTEVAHDLRTPLTAIRGVPGPAGGGRAGGGPGAVPLPDPPPGGGHDGADGGASADLSCPLRPPAPGSGAGGPPRRPGGEPGGPSTPRFSGGASRPRWPSLRNRWSAPWTARP